MSKRVQELIEQATTREKGPPSYDLTYNIVYEHFDKEKFADLLLQDIENALRKRAKFYLDADNFVGEMTCLEFINILNANYRK